MIAMRKKFLKYKLAVCFLLIIFFSNPLFAHTINYSLEKEPTEAVLLYYLKLGFRHIIPGGIDHILFVSALCLLSNKIKTILWQATAFTVAHSVTLALSLKNVISVPSAITEPIIAMSIGFVAIENILFSELKAWRILIVFMFGLVHGMGFASALNEIGLPPNKFYTSIIAFNGGVELGHPEESGHGCLLYDTTQMVPLVFRMSSISQGLAVETQVRLVDIAPTVYELLRIHYTGCLDGISLCPAFSGHEIQFRVGYSETYFPHEQYEASGLFPSARNLKAIRLENRYKIIWEVDGESVAVYDLVNDPNEKQRLG